MMLTWRFVLLVIGILAALAMESAARQHVVAHTTPALSRHTAQVENL